MEKAAIAFLDILGFKGIWQNRNSDDVLEIMGGVGTTIQNTYKQPPPEKGWPKSELPEITILSDTIVVVIKSDEPHCIFLLANIVYGLYRYFWNANLFLRGAVSWGDFSQSDSTFIGPAIDDVASWYETANWIGVVLTPKTNYLLDRFPTTTIEINGVQVPPFIKYQVPDKANKKHHLYALNWPAYLQANYKLPGSEPNDKVKMLMFKMFSEQPAFNSSILEKYENTLQFVDHSLDDFGKRNR